jgi:hypothetical protein
VVIGTALADLTDISVIGEYSDGAERGITDYNLSGSIGLGENTITVSYGGFTATIIVVGIEEEIVEDWELYKDIDTSKIYQGVGLGANYNSTPYPYSRSASDRTSYVDFDIEVSQNYVYKFEAETEAGNERIGPMFYAQYFMDNVFNVQGNGTVNDGIEDAGWKALSGDEFRSTKLQTPARLRFSFEGGTVVVKKCRLYRKSVSA